MKRTILIFPIIALALATLACQVSVPSSVRGSGDVETETREVSSFDAIVLENEGDVYITVGQSESLTIEAEDNLLPFLTSKVEGGVLKLGTVFGKNLNPTKPIRFNVTVKDLNSITLASSGNIHADDLLETARMTILLAGSGNISLQKMEVTDLKVTLAGSGNISLDQVNAESVNATVSGSGNISIAGQTPEQKLGVFGSGNYAAGDLETEMAEITITGSGNTTVWVKEQLNASVNGSGDINYYGKPTINLTDNGSGSLRSLGEK